MRLKRKMASSETRKNGHRQNEHFRKSRSVPNLRRPPADVFLNIPYDNQFQSLCLAYICGITTLGFFPRATLEIPGGARRLDRVFALIKDCRYSIHDLSRVELDKQNPPTPRFNMPFELGLSVAWERIGKHKHTWYVFEKRPRRLAKSLSDLNGTDEYIHGGTMNGVFRELCSAFVRPGRQPSVQQIRKVHLEVESRLPEILRRAGTKSIFTARVFKDICLVAVTASAKNVR
jgi:hypothetical protein